MRSKQIQCNDTMLPIEKLYAIGASKLMNAELIAILLGQGVFLKLSNASIPVTELAEHLHDQTPSLAELRDQLASGSFTMKGIGPVKRARLLAAFELGSRSLELNSGPIEIEPLAKLAWLTLKDEVRERFIYATNNASGQFSAFQSLRVGDLGGVCFTPRHFFERVFESECSSVVVAHNHPGGSPLPSIQDSESTLRLIRLAEMLDVNVLDHLIVTPQGQVYSFKYQRVLTIS